LGFHVRAGRLQLTPCIPAHWPGFEICFKHASARYEIRVENPQHVSRGVVQIDLDGTTLSPGETQIVLVDDGHTHDVRVVLG
jgi:cyclic beta-1,2-glucan synthetase